MSALPIVIAAGAAVLLIGKKKKKKAVDTEGEEPDIAPGEGYEEEDVGRVTIRQARVITPEQHLAVARMAYPADIDPDALGKKALDDQAQDEVEEEARKKAREKIKKKKKGERKCEFGTVSLNRKEVCWGDRAGFFTGGVPAKRKMRRIPKYKTARRLVAAVAMTGGTVASPIMRTARARFILYCWINRKRKKLYRCTKRWKTGKKRCRRYKRY